MTIQAYPASTLINTESSTSAEWYLQVARGLVPGASQVNIVGYQPSVGTTFIPIWENTTTYRSEEHTSELQSH